MRRFLIFAALAAALFVGCGGSSSPSSGPSRPTPTPNSSKSVQGLGTCHHKVPAQAGECIRQELQSRGITPGAPLATLLFGIHATCVDVSRWQGFPNWALIRQAGVKCVIVQTNDGRITNPLFTSQVNGALAAHLVVGCYLFAEAGSPSFQAAVLRGLCSSSRITAGAWVDAEVSGAYPVACAIVNVLRRHYRIVGVYGSPGTYRGGVCGYSWPAEWGSGRAYPLPGFSSSSIKLRQNCGTCRIRGFSGEVDRDEDLGLLALAKPVPPKPARRVLLRHRESLRRLLLTYGCRRRTHQHERLGPRCRKWYASGQRVNRELGLI